MITGVVNAGREAIARLEGRGPRGERREIDTILDTGLNGFLTLPHTVITALALPHLGRGRAILVDGSEALFDLYETAVVWERERRVVEVEATRGVALLGMAMLDGHDLRIRVIEGGRVTIEAAR
jgi:clan AA aspartic protease